MLKFIKTSSKKYGLSPGTLVHIGERKVDKVTIKIIDFNESAFNERDAEKDEDYSRFTEAGSVTWINVNGIHDPAVMEKLGKAFKLHPLVQEDILNARQRPKVEEYDDCLFIVLKMLHYDEETREIKAEQLSMILGKNTVITFQEMEGDVFNPVRERIRSSKGRIRKSGGDYLAYALIDSVIDHYFIMLEKVGEEIEQLEEELLNDPELESLQRIHRLRREMIFTRRSAWPAREVINSLRKADKFIDETTGIFLRDVYDHCIVIIDTIEIFRDMLSGMLDLYMSSAGNKANEIMKVLTIFASIFIPLTFLAGIWGMNFQHMPELEWPWAYPAVLFLMLLTGLGMLLYFRRKKWL